MKLAVLLQCHKNINQIKLLLGTLQHPDVYVFIHLDKKANMNLELQRFCQVYLLPDHLRIDVQWGRLSQVDATLNLIMYAQSKGKFDYFWLISGQDLLLKNISQIVEILQINPGWNYIEAAQGHAFRKRIELFYPHWLMGSSILQRLVKRMYQEVTGGRNQTYRPFLRKNLPTGVFYFESQWWCLSAEAIQWIINYLAFHREYHSFFDNAICPDETFFQTFFMLSPYAANRKEKLCYVKWENTSGGHPKLLTMEDYPELNASNACIARKFDMNFDAKIVLRLINRVQSSQNT